MEPPARNLIKYVSLILMLIQNSGFVLMMRYSRQQQQEAQVEQYSVAVVIVMQEFFKLVLCLAMIATTQSTSAALEALVQPREISRVAIPAACFTLQNNILYVALSNLEPLLFQISYQIKTLLTALLSVKILRRVLSRWQWLSQLLLTVGVVMAQMGEPAKKQQAPSDGAGGDAAAPQRSLLLGMSAVLTAAFSSSYASVYFERLLKETPMLPPPGDGDSPSPKAPKPQSTLWHRNTQLCIWTVPMNVLLALIGASASGTLGDVLQHPLRGFQWSTWSLVIVNGLGGLLVAVVMKYADNILKGFATAGAIIVTGIMAPLLALGPPPSMLLILGGVLVIASLFLYSAKPGGPAPAVVSGRPVPRSV